MGVEIKYMENWVEVFCVGYMAGFFTLAIILSVLYLKDDKI